MTEISELIAEARELADDAESIFEPGWPVELVRTFCDCLEVAEAELAELRVSVAAFEQMTAGYEQMCATYDGLCAFYQNALESMADPHRPYYASDPVADAQEALNKGAEIRKGAS